MNNKRKVLLIILAVLLVATTVGTASAYMFKKSAPITNEFDPALVDCSVSMTKNGDTIESIQITNTGSIDAYLRIRIVTYWVNANGEIVYKPSSELNISTRSDWLRGSNNTFYYPSPVAPAGQLFLLADGFAFELAVEDDGTKQVIQVFGEAVQALPTSSVINAWGVKIENNKITQVP